MVSGQTRLDRLSLAFAALSGPSRREALSSLAKGERSVTELAAPYELTLPAITKHLKVLERARLITRSIHYPRRIP